MSISENIKLPVASVWAPASSLRLFSLRFPRGGPQIQLDAAGERRDAF